MYYMQHHDPGLLKISPCTCSRVVTRMFYMVTLHISLFVTYPILWMTGWSRWEFCKMFFSASFSLLSASYAPYNHMLYSTLNSFRSANLIKTTMKSKYFCSCNCMNTSLESLFILRYALLHVIWRMCTHVRRCLKIALGTFFYYPTSLIHEVCRKSAFVKKHSSCFSYTKTAKCTCTEQSLDEYQEEIKKKWRNYIKKQKCVAKLVEPSYFMQYIFHPKIFFVWKIIIHFCSNYESKAFITEDLA